MGGFFVPAALFLTEALLFLTVGTQAFTCRPACSVRPGLPIGTHRPLQLYASNDLAETFREAVSAPPEQIIDAVTKAPAYRLTVSDAAALGGVDLIEARNGLMTLSTLTGATLEVTQDGDIIYGFSQDFKEKLSRRSPIVKLRKLAKVLYPPFFYVVRASFGLALFTSLAIIASAVVVAAASGGGSSSSSNKNNDDSNKPRASYSSSRFDIMFPSSSDFYYPFRSTGTTYYEEKDNVPDYTTPTVEKGYRGRKLYFVESFFSFVFGDGDPNTGFSQAQLQQISSMIRANGGVVVAEQLAPYLDPPLLPVSLQASMTDSEMARNVQQVFGKFPTSTIEEDSVIVDESWVLPAVIKLGGEPRVTPNGNIFYTFPDLATTAFFKSAKESDEPSEQVFEKPVPFSKATNGQLVIAGTLGVVNFLGMRYISYLLKSPAFLQSSPVYSTALHTIYPALAVYAYIYVCTPIFRILRLQTVNGDIRKRNLKRSLWASILIRSGLRKDSSTQQAALPPASVTTVDEKILDVKQHASSSLQNVIGRKLSDIFFSSKQP